MNGLGLQVTRVSVIKQIVLDTLSALLYDMNDQIVGEGPFIPLHPYFPPHHIQGGRGGEEAGRGKGRLRRGKERGGPIEGRGVPHPPHLPRRQKNLIFR